jgi:thiopurine S-methyltransferase
MDAKFWITAWEEGRTAFHQAKYNKALLDYFPQLSPSIGQSVLVPLCGKSRDLLWLSDLKLEVHGVELYEEAVKEFFMENDLKAPEISQAPDFRDYVSGNIKISVGDFFKLSATAAYDLIYDRASLVALPEAMRRDYAALLTKALKPGGGYLLVAYQYDQETMEGPPFSVTESEVSALYEKNFSIELVETNFPTTEGSRLSSVSTLKQKIYLLRKR